MAQPLPSFEPPPSRAGRHAGKPFFGLIESVIVEEPAEFEFDGAILRRHAAAAWTWIFRDVAPDLVDPDSLPDEPAARQALEALMPELLARAKDRISATRQMRNGSQRLVTQLGGEDEARRLPVVLNALRCRGLLDKAQVFGRAANGMPDDGALATALEAMPWGDADVAALIMQAAMGHAANPSRIVTAVIRLADGATDLEIERAGYGPVVDALLAHAQNQIPLLGMQPGGGPFVDIDLACRAIERFHRLVRAVNAYVEMSRSGRWPAIIGGLVKAASARVEPRLREVVTDLNMAMRRHREGMDRIDSDQILRALNGAYLIATVRDCRDSLAVNAVFDQVWHQLGQALEIHLERNLEALRANPEDPFARERLEAAIKVAELRFSLEYAEVLRRARDAAMR